MVRIVSQLLLYCVSQFAGVNVKYLELLKEFLLNLKLDNQTIINPHINCNQVNKVR